MAPIPYAELHCHSNFSFLDGSSAPDDLVERAVELGLTGLAVTDHNGLYGAVRFVSAAEAAGLHSVVGLEIELIDPAVADPAGIVILPRRPRRPRRRGSAAGLGQTPGVPGETQPLDPSEGRPARPRPVRARLPGHRPPVKEDLRGIGERVRGLAEPRIAPPDGAGEGAPEHRSERPSRCVSEERKAQRAPAPSRGAPS